MSVIEPVYDQEQVTKQVIAQAVKETKRETKEKTKEESKALFLKSLLDAGFSEEEAIKLIPDF